MVLCLVYRSFPEPLFLCGRYTGPGSEAICCTLRMLIGLLGVSAVGLLLQQAGGHVAMRFCFGFHSAFHMQRMSHYSILLSLHRTRKTMWDGKPCRCWIYCWHRLRTVGLRWYFTRTTKVEKLLTWISNILVLILPVLLSRSSEDVQSIIPWDNGIMSHSSLCSSFLFLYNHWCDMI